MLGDQTPTIPADHAEGVYDIQATEQMRAAKDAGESPGWGAGEGSAVPCERLAAR